MDVDCMIRSNESEKSRVASDEVEDALLGERARVNRQFVQVATE